MTKKEKWMTLFPSNSFKSEFQNNGANILLFNSLDEGEIDCLLNMGYQIIGFWAPASQLDFTIEKQTKLIIFDISYFKKFSPRYCTSILLHEIGHCFSQKYGLDGEFEADDFALQKGYRNELLEVIDNEIQTAGNSNFLDERRKRIIELP